MGPPMVPMPKMPIRGLSAMLAPFSALVDLIASRVGRPPVLVARDALRGGVDAQGAQNLVADYAEAMWDVRRQRHRIAGLEADLAIFLAIDPRFGHAFQHVEHLEIGMLVHGSEVTRLRGLDARADRRGALVVADDELVRRIGTELHHFRICETDHLQVSHGMSPFVQLSPSPSRRERAG